MTGIEVLAGLAAVYVMRKLHVVGQGVDREVDHVLSAGLDSLHEAVNEALGDDPALALLENEAAKGEEIERTVRRVADAITEAADSDSVFAQRLEGLIAQIREADAQNGDRPVGSSITVTQTAHASGKAAINQAGRDLRGRGGEANR